MNRRSFIAGGPVGAFGLGSLAFLLDAQQSPAAREISTDVLDFWVNKVGIPADMLLPEGSRGRRGPSEAAFHGSGRSYATTYGSEPLFLYVDDKENRVVPAQDIRPEALLAAGDTVVEMQVGRLRLNKDDQARFDDFSSTGLYLDVQQKSSSAADNPLNLGWSMLGAMLPGKYVKKSAAAATNTSSGDSGALRSIALPGGGGKTMFNCFLKGQKRSPFASFLTAFSEIGLSAGNEFLPMLQLPGVSGAALMGVRALVGKLQGMGGNHHWLFQTSPVDVACTAEAASAGESIRFRTGHYVVLPKSQANLMRESKNNLKVLDGFLVPKEASLLDVYEAAPATAAGVSYLSMRVNVKKTHLNGCRVIVPGV
jgi:hypothetical protein